jgi:hypothetical protein
MAVCQAGLTALTKYAGGGRTAAGVTLLFDFGSLFSFLIGIFLVPFQYDAEIAPLCIRAKVTAMSADVNWMFNFLFAEATPLGFDNLGWKYYLCYMCTSTLAFVVFYFFCPETMNRGLEDIDEVFLRSDNIFAPVKIARMLQMDPRAAAALDSKVEKAEHEEHRRRSHTSA